MPDTKDRNTNSWSIWSLFAASPATFHDTKNKQFSNLPGSGFVVQGKSKKELKIQIHNPVHENAWYDIISYHIISYYIISYYDCQELRVKTQVRLWHLLLASPKRSPQVRLLPLQLATPGSWFYRAGCQWKAYRKWRTIWADSRRNHDILDW